MPCETTPATRSDWQADTSAAIAAAVESWRRLMRRPRDEWVIGSSYRRAVESAALGKCSRRSHSSRRSGLPLANELCLSGLNQRSAAAQLIGGDLEQNRRRV